MGFTYPGKFTYLNTFVMQVAQRCSDNQGSTVLQKQNDTTKTKKKTDKYQKRLQRKAKRNTIGIWYRVPKEWAVYKEGKMI